MQEKIIQLLKDCRGYLSGEDISRRLKISRAGIWKHMQELRHIGYDIEAMPHRGYRLVSPPDRLLPREIKYGLGTKILGRDIIYHELTQSTMDDAFSSGAQGAEEGTVIIAESQSKGRGRMGRSWISPKGKGIYMSVILRPQFSPNDFAKLTLLAAVAVCEALRKVSDLDIGIKWPNDLLAGGRKLAGILTELNAEVDQMKFVVVGLGVNINASKRALPGEATSLKIESGKSHSRVAVVQEILRSLEYWYADIERQGFEHVLKRWRELALILGKRIIIKEHHQEIHGEAVDLADDGGLIIRTDSGETIKRLSGDVVQAG